MHSTIGIFGGAEAGAELAGKLAKKGTVNDIAIFNHASSEGVFSYVTPASDKLQPLLQAAAMADFPIIIFKDMTKEFGEQLVAIDAAGFASGIIVDAGIGKQAIEQALKGTSLSGFEIIPNEPAAIRQEVIRLAKEIAAKRDTEAPAWLPIDNYFAVKGVGTVVLTVVKRGKVKKYDTLRIEPLGKEATIKSMQSQDNDVAEADAGMRLGACLKGVEADELKRGYVLCKEGTAKVSQSVKLKFTKSRYSKEVLAKGTTIYLACGLQVIAGTVESIEKEILTITLEKPIAHLPSERCILGSTKPALPRILGFGVIEG